MTRTFWVCCWCFVAVALVLGTANGASAQTKINQTSCVSGCLSQVVTLLQDIEVVCAGPSTYNLQQAVMALEDRSGPNRIRLTGSGSLCSQPLNVRGFNNLTIEGNGTTLIRGVNIINSRGVTLKNLTLDFAAAGGSNLNLNGAAVSLDGVTVKNAQFNEGISLRGSRLGFGPSAPSAIINNYCSGIKVGAGSQAGLANVTISGNGQSGCGHLGKQGVVSESGGAVTFFNYVLDANGSQQAADINITGNLENGILMEGGWISSEAENGNGLVHVYNNGGLGAEINSASGDLTGHFKFEGNAPNGTDFDPNPLQIGVSGSGWLNIGQGAEVVGGMAALFGGTIVVGNGGGMTVTGGLTFTQGGKGIDAGNNSIDTVACDGTSWLLRFDNSSTIGTNTCPSDGPSGIKGDKGDTGEQGIQGIQGIQGVQGVQGIQGPPGLSGREVVTTTLTNQIVAKAAQVPVAADCPAGKVVLGGGSSTTNLNIAVLSSLPTSATQWTVVFRNSSNNSQMGTLTTTAVCATTPAP